MENVKCGWTNRKKTTVLTNQCFFSSSLRAIADYYYEAAMADKRGYPALPRKRERESESEIVLNMVADTLTHSLAHSHTRALTLP